MRIDRGIPICSVKISRESEGKGAIDAVDSIRIIMIKRFGVRDFLLFASWTA